MAGPNIGQFMNPYTSMVTGQTLSDLERQRQMAVNTTGAQATQAGAFGGSRHGVAEALTNEGFARQGAQTFGNLQQQGFNTALGAAQAQQGTLMSGAAQLGQLGNQAFNTGRTISQDQMQQGLMQQGLQQALIDAARGQYAGFTGAPTAVAVHLPLAALGATPNRASDDHAEQAAWPVRLPVARICSLLRHPPQDQTSSSSAKRTATTSTRGTGMRMASALPIRSSRQSASWLRSFRRRIRISLSLAQTASCALTTADWRRRQPDEPE